MRQQRYYIPSPLNNLLLIETGILGPISIYLLYDSECWKAVCRLTCHIVARVSTNWWFVETDVAFVVCDDTEWNLSVISRRNSRSVVRHHRNNRYIFI